MEIEAEEFTRTNNGLILKILEYDKVLDMYLCTDNKYKTYIGKEYIVKHSKDILDLIEVGDYINGVKIDEIIEKNENEICFRYNYYLDKNDVYTIQRKHIKSILTHEQFKQVEYRLEE